LLGGFGMSELSVLFADEFDVVSKRFCEYKKLGFSYRTCEKDGSVVLDEIAKNPVDVLVIDFFMKSIDALGVLERIRTMNPLYCPAVIVLSSVDSLAVRNEFYNKGAYFYLKKPVTAELLISKINEIKSVRESNKLKPNSQRYFEESEAIITQAIQQICMPAHVKGYNYVRHAIKLCVESPAYVNAITKQLYPAIARSYAVSSESVERDIRTAIDLAWTRGSTDGFSKYFGYNNHVRKRRPTNAEFIARISDEIRITYNVG
jgi:two-component system response regulator (stage 0 sporulation protein A)